MATTARARSESEFIGGKVRKESKGDILEVSRAYP
jgi:hypothetical protein